MKLENKPLTTLQTSDETSRFHLAHGLVGFPDLVEMEIVYVADQLPFMWIRHAGGSGLSFLVVNPADIMEDYRIEVSDEDVDFLQLASPKDSLVLNITTFHNSDLPNVTVNLVGPLLINKRTRKGKQVVINNFADYSATFSLRSCFLDAEEDEQES